MICCICGSKQSVWIEDFALSNSHPELRICAKCHDRQMNMLGKIESEDFSEAAHSFYEWIKSHKNLAHDVEEYLAEVIEQAQAQHQEWEDRQSNIKVQEETQRLADEAKKLADES